MKVAIITCYKLPDYGRSVALRSALESNPDYDVVVIKNSHQGVLRYLEVLFKTISARLRERPDVFLITFRGYEILPAILLIALGKPVILDELINPLEVVAEHRQLYRGKLRGQLMAGWTLVGGIYNWLLRRCALIIADTQAHANYDAQLSHAPPNRYVVIPVGADEDIFKPQQEKQAKHVSEDFTVLYYGTMAPLHGLDYVIEAAQLLKDQPTIQFLLVGGGKETSRRIEQAVSEGAHITHKSWIEPVDLPGVIARAGVCLGGPFGNTVQSQLITTGKTYQFLASATPVIIGQTEETKTSGLFKDKVNCLLVPQANAQALADAVIWAKTHPVQRTRLAQAGRDLFEQHFSQAVIAGLLTKLLNQLA